MFPKSVRKIQLAGRSESAIELTRSATQESRLWCGGVIPPLPEVREVDAVVGVDVLGDGGRLTPTAHSGPPHLPSTTAHHHHHRNSAS